MEVIRSVESKTGLIFKRRVQVKKTWWDLSPKLQRKVLSSLDYHSLLQCRLVSKNLQCQVDKVVEQQKLDPDLFWNPYFNDPKDYLLDAKLLLGLVRFQSAAELKQFVEQYDTSEPEAPHQTINLSVTTPTLVKITPEPAPLLANKSTEFNLPPVKKPSAPAPPPTTTTPDSTSQKKPSRHQACLLDQCPPQKPATAKSPPSTLKAASSKSKPSNFSSPKTQFNAGRKLSHSQPPIRPKTAPSSFGSTSPSIKPPVKSAVSPVYPAAAASSPVKSAVPPVCPAASSTVKPAVPPVISIASPTVKPVLQATVNPTASTVKAVKSTVVAKKKSISQQPVNPSKPPKLFGFSFPGLLFPVGSVFIRRCLHDCDGDQQSSKNKILSVDSTKVILQWTLRLIQDYGKQLTSFSFDDGTGERSNLTFEQLRSILRQLPNLVFLGITAGNYEHHVDIEEMLENEEEIEKLPALEHLRIVSLGHNGSYHLHMDILTAYGCQLRRLICSKFGLFVRSPFGYYVSTNNSLQKLLEYSKSVRTLYPNMLSSLEELKVPLLSSQCLLREVEPLATGPVPVPWIHWGNLKRLSLFYIHRGGSYGDCCLADVWSLLNSFSSTLEELCLDFQACSDFIEWISSDARPLPASVFEPCPKLRKLCISAAALLRSEDLAGMISSKCPNLEILTFFKWSSYYKEAIENNNRQGEYFNGGPTPVTIPGHMGFFWKELAMLQRASIRVDTWKDDCIYKKDRQEMLFVPKKEATYIF